MNDNTSKWIKKIEAELEVLGKKHDPGYWKPESYIVGQGSSKLIFINIKMPLIRNLLKNKKLFPPREDLFKQVQAMWFESQVYEAKTLSLMWMDQQKNSYLVQHQKDVVRWAAEIDNWAHSDGLSSMLARIFEQDSKYLIKVFQKWNKHKHSWYRRLSLVSLFYYSMSRSKYPSYKLAEGFVTANFDHPEYYVQKGVGWTLREMYNVYPTQTLKFLNKNVRKISSIAWVAATEKLTKNQKNSLKKRRT